MDNVVELFMYDLSDGWCKNLGPLCPVSAVWHTSTVVYGKEYVFGDDGIKFHQPGKPHKRIVLGGTNITPHDFKIYVKRLKYSTWTASSYDLFRHNCNHFTEHIVQFLGVGPVPRDIFESVEKLIKSPIYGKMVDMIARNAQIYGQNTQPNYNQ